MELTKLTDVEFKKMAMLVYDRTGIHLPESKITLLSNRIRKRLRELKLDGYMDYYKLLNDPKRCDEELPNFLSAITTNETYFFRNEHLWKFIQDTWIPEMVEKKSKKTKTIRVWSAASSTGEEAYTMALCLREGLPNPAQWRVNVIGSDISPKVLEQAKQAIYGDYAVSKISKTLLLKWFEKKEDQYKLKQDVRKWVSFESHNLRDPFPNAHFDLVFLRNVLMYFDTPMKRKVLQNVIQAVTPGGYMVVGDVDPIRNHKELADVVKMDYSGPNLYQKPVNTSQRAAIAAGK